MIAPQKSHSIPVAKLQGKKKRNGQDNIEASVWKITHEDETGLWAVTCVAKELF